MMGSMWAPEEKADYTGGEPVKLWDASNLVKGYSVYVVSGRADRVGQNGLVSPSWVICMV